MSIYQTYWLALGLFSLVMTLAWMFIPRRTTMTTLVAGFSWATLALSGGDVTAFSDSANEFAVPVDNSIRLFVAGLALLSLIAFLLSQFGGYPPEQQVKDIPE